MKISALEEYGLRCLVQLARESAEPGSSITISTRQIAEREGLGVENAAQIMTTLRKAGFVSSIRGVHGGFRLARPAAATTVGAIFRAFEAPFADSICDSFTGQLETCANADDCSVAPIWQELSRRIYGFLDSITLAHIAAGNVQRAPQVVPLATLGKMTN